MTITLENTPTRDWSWPITFFSVTLFHATFGVTRERACSRETLLSTITNVTSTFHMAVMTSLVTSPGCTRHCLTFGANAGLVTRSILWVPVCNATLAWLVTALLKATIRYYDVAVFCWWRVNAGSQKKFRYNHNETKHLKFLWRDTYVNLLLENDQQIIYVCRIQVNNGVDYHETWLSGYSSRAPPSGLQEVIGPESCWGLRIFFLCHTLVTWWAFHLFSPYSLNTFSNTKVKRINTIINWEMLPWCGTHISTSTMVI